MKKAAMLFLSVFLLYSCNKSTYIQDAGKDGYDTGTIEDSGTGLPDGTGGISDTDSLGTGSLNGTGAYSNAGGTGYEVISSEDISYYPGNPQYEGYLAKPAKDGRYPGLIIIHEYWGLNDNIKDFANRFANQGYVVLAVDMYGTGATTDSGVASQMAAKVRSDTASAFKNLNAAVAYMRGLKEVDPQKLGTVGWCFGGGWAYEMAKNDLGTDVSVMYYGRFSPDDDLSMMRSDILGHFGEKDTSILVDDVREFQAKLKTLSGEHAVYIYPNAGHGFANDKNPAAYNKEAADLAWQRTLEFLKENLK